MKKKHGRKVWNKLISLQIILCIIATSMPTAELLAKTVSEEIIREDELLFPEMLNVMENEGDIGSMGGEASNVNGFIAPIDDPDASAIRITTAEELAGIADNMYGSYVLMNDIDLSDYGNWLPIGKISSEAFCGKFDGQGHKIKGLSVSETIYSGTVQTPYYAIGLFGVCDGAQIKNVFLEDVNISISTTSGYRYENSILDSDGSVFAGAVVGYAKNSTIIYNCYTSGNVSASASGEGYSPAISGGLMGYGNTVLVSYCYNLSNVDAYNGNATSKYNAYAGGLIGRVEIEGVIDCSYNSGDISSCTMDYGDSFAGGLIADTSISSTNITNSFNEGNVQGVAGNLFSDSAYAGGIVATFQGSIDKVYNSGTVTAQAKDPYQINNNTAYAGGICANSAIDSTISNSAIVQTYVSADASGTKYQNRISNSGTKSNNITIDSVSANSTNDANIIEEISTMKNMNIYVDTLHWDFVKTWEMKPEKDFPQLRMIDVDSEEYNTEYIQQHLEFINSSAYSDILNNYRWAQIYWSEENNFKSNVGGALYTVTDKAVDFVTLNIADLFENNDPFPVMLADYIAEQSVIEEYEEIYTFELKKAYTKTYKKVKSFLKSNWEEGYGQLEDEDIFYLFYYDKQSSEQWINQDFEKYLSAIVETDIQGEDKGKNFREVLGITSEAFDEILNMKEFYDEGVSYINVFLKYAVSLEAYRETDKYFKTVLSKMRYNIPKDTDYVRYGSKLINALNSYVDYEESEDEIIQFEVAHYIGDTWKDESVDFISLYVKQKKSSWLKQLVKNGTMSQKTLNAYNAISSAADNTWKVMEYVTKNGELQECRELLRANAYFENTVYNTLREIESDFKVSNTYENACLFDAAFKFLKASEISSMDTVIQYFNKYQTSWLAAIKNGSNTFMNSAIEEVHINKLHLYNTYCHGTSYTLGGKNIIIACPTNVYIYDESGNLVVSIENDVVTQCTDNILAYTADAVKLVTVPTDQNYSVKIDAIDNGKMSYSVSEYNSKMENIQTTLYPQVQINKGDSYTGTVNSEIETTPETYNLVGSDDTIIDKYELVEKNTNIPVQAIEIDTDDVNNVLSIGDTFELTAKIIPENATNQSFVWSSSDGNIISVSENGTIEAKSSGVATVYAKALYGGTISAVTFIVLSDNQTVYITKQPEGATYVKNEVPKELSVSYYQNSDVTAIYQWYYATKKDLSDGKAIVGETNQSIMPDTTSAGIYYYYMVISAGDEIATSDVAVIDVLEKQILDSGVSENGLIWEIDSDYTLTVSGSGDMDKYSSESDVPWNQYRNLIKKIVIEEGISSISYNAFSNSTAVTEVSVSKSVEYIDVGTFEGCNSLEEIKVPFVGTCSNATDGDAVFGAIFGKVASGGTVQYYKLEGTTLSGYQYNIPESLRKVKLIDATNIPFGAFYNCTNFNEIEMNEGIESIENYSFCNCTGLTDLIIPKSVASIGEGALKGCTSLVSITIPFIGANRDVSGTYEGAFGYIFGRTSSSDSNYYVQYPIVNGTSLSGYGYAVPTNLDTVIVTDATQIPIGAFSNLKDLKYVTLNSKITEIREYAFYNATGLTDIYYQDWKTNWEKISIGSGNTVLDNVIMHYLESMSKLIGASLRLTGDIGVNFYYEFSDEMISDPSTKVLVTVGNDETEEFNINDAIIDTTSVSGKTLYKFTCYVKAKQMNDQILIQAVSDTSEEEIYTYSVRKYAENIISNDKYSDELKYLVRVMMYYGSCAQLYLNYNIDNLANSGMEMDDIIEMANGITVGDLEEYVAGTTLMPEGISIYAANLSLLSETVLRYHFILEEGYDTSNYTFIISGNEYEPVFINGRYCIEIKNIRAQDIDEMFTVTVIDENGNSGTVTYGALTYVRNIINVGTSKYSQELIDTVRSLYLYNQATKSYVESKS